MKTLTPDEIKPWLVNRQGKDFIQYAGLLHLAHTRGLLSLSSRVVQAPLEANNRTAICEAEAVFQEIDKQGDITHTIHHTFRDVGDANEQNVGRLIALHIIRMASTRAKARCLRDALNVGYVSAEETGDYTEGEEQPSTKQIKAPATPAVKPQEKPAPAPEAPKRPSPSASPGASQEPCTDGQIKSITDLCKKLGRPVPPSVADLDFNTATDIIAKLAGEFNARAKGGR